MIFTEAFLLFNPTFRIWTVVQVFIDVILYENHTIVKVHIVWNLPQHSMSQRMFGLTRSVYEVCLSHIFYLIKLIYSHIPNSYILSYINRIYSHSHILPYIILIYHTHLFALTISLVIWFLWLIQYSLQSYLSWEIICCNLPYSTIVYAVIISQIWPIS